jgi:hypothetical protein
LQAGFVKAVLVGEVDVDAVKEDGELMGAGREHP